MQINEFLNRVQMYFGYLFEGYGFTVQFRECYKDFGNCLAVLGSGECRIAVARDRSQVLVDIISPLSSDDRFTLTNVVGFLTRRDSEPYDPLRGLAEIYAGSEEQQWEKLGSLLQQYCSPILCLFQRQVFEREQQQLKEYIGQKTAALVKEIEKGVR